MTELLNQPNKQELTPDPTQRGIVGLANLGNTCFMNAAIQAFRNCPEWTLFCKKGGELDQYIYTNNSNSARVAYAYQDLIHSIWAGTGPAHVRPVGFYEDLRKIVKGTIYEDFTRRTPQDAHEFLVWLLDQMYMGTQKEVQMTITNEDSLEPMMIQAIKGWKQAFEKQYSPLTDLVFGMFRRQYTCSGCKTIHTRWETFNVLKVSLAKGQDGNPLTLEDCIKEEYKDESIDGYACDACKEKHTALKQTTIWRLPKVLILTLSRFTPMGTRDNSPLIYDGHPLCLDAVFSKESEEPSRLKEYNLFGTVDHHGHHMGGHYTAQCFSPVWKKWHLYDDENVYAIEKPRFGVETYMMMFR
jgi:ubiquitin C-terminal hydrolase